MRKRLIYGSGVLLLAILFTLIVWQGSFNFGEFGPSSPEQTYAVWAVSTLIFLLTVTLGFMLVRNFARLWVDRQSNREGSRIRSKLVLGALALSCVPVFFSVLFNIYVLNRTLEKWFTRPAENIKMDFVAISEAIAREHQAKARAQAEALAVSPEVKAAAADHDRRRLAAMCRERGILALETMHPGEEPVRLCSPETELDVGSISVSAPMAGGGMLRLTSTLPIDLETVRSEIDREVRNYDRLTAQKKSLRLNYLQLLTLITLFILFFATWIALFLSKQISTPISALLGGANQVRAGNLAYRVQVGAVDEMASLVRAFNEMTADLEANRHELETRKRFTEAVLESIPSGVISISPNYTIQLVNRALKGFFPAELVDRAKRIEDLFPPEDAGELRYLMNRARRVGIAASQFELRTAQGKIVPMSATVAALEDKSGSGYVVVLEDTSDLLRAQKFAAWHEIARRIAHEIKNPLTPIALCAERIARQLDRRADHPDTEAIMRECSELICAEVESLKTLVNEFSQFARFPAAQPAASDLNEVVESALSVFQGRLQSIDLQKALAPDLPQVNIDREHFKRLVINLVDNAAEAMEKTPLKRLFIGTAVAGPDTVELVIADTGCGISAEDKQKLFLPYFSTKGRGTGLGLAIVNHIVSEHNAHIRVEDNQPAGARFIVEIASLTPVEQSEPRSVEMPA